jgi:hypothetical protein
MNKDTQPPADDLASTMPPKAFSERVAAWLWLSIAAALLAAAGSLIGLTVERIYADLTPAFLPQAIAQDIANLLIAAPVMVVLAALARRDGELARGQADRHPHTDLARAASLAALDDTDLRTVIPYRQ